MSSEFLGTDEGQGVDQTSRHENSDNVPSRRKFIRNVAIGTAGAAVAMSNIDSLRGASRLLERYTNRHVDGFLEAVRNATRSPAAKREFQRISNLVLETVGNDQKSRSTFMAVKSYLSNPLVSLPADQGSTMTDVDMVIGAGYLRVLAGLQDSKRHVSADDVKNRLENPKGIFDTFESGFIKQLHAKTKAECAVNPAFGKKLAEASKEANGIASYLVNQATTSTGAKLIPASFVQGCDCTINGVCATTEECIIAVAIIVIIIIVAK